MRTTPRNRSRAKGIFIGQRNCETRSPKRQWCRDKTVRDDCGGPGGGGRVKDPPYHGPARRSVGSALAPDLNQFRTAFWVRRERRPYKRRLTSATKAR